MALFKFQNHSAIKNAQNNPRLVATEVIKNGYLFKVEDNYDVEGDGSVILKEAAVPFADATEAQGDVWVAFNIVDKPETLNYADFQVEVGEFVRGFNLTKMHGEIIEVSSDIVDIADPSTIAVGDILIPCNETDDADNPMHWKVAGELDTGYAVAMEVIGLTTFGSFTVDAGVGLEVKVKSN